MKREPFLLFTQTGEDVECSGEFGLMAICRCLNASSHDFCTYLISSLSLENHVASLAQRFRITHLLKVLFEGGGVVLLERIKVGYVVMPYKSCCRTSEKGPQVHDGKYAGSDLNRLFSRVLRGERVT